MKTQLTKSQFKTYGPRPIAGYGHNTMITARVRYDDQCGNGHNTFSITAEVVTPEGRKQTGGCLHEEIARVFPELAPFIKWHLVSSDGPMHYIANSTYWAKEGNLDFARSCAVWPDATDEELLSPDLEQKLRDRLPALMEEFRTAVESLGFTF